MKRLDESHGMMSKFVYCSIISNEKALVDTAEDFGPLCTQLATKLSLLSIDVEENALGKMVTEGESDFQKLGKRKKKREKTQNSLIFLFSSVWPDE